MNKFWLFINIFQMVFFVKQRVQYNQYPTPSDQSHCRYFYKLGILLPFRPNTLVKIRGEMFLI